MMDAEALVFVVDDDACIWVSSKHQCAPQQSGASHMFPLHSLVNFLLVY